MARAELRKADVKETLKTMFRDIEKMKWKQREKLSFVVVESAVKFAEEYLKARDGRLGDFSSRWKKRLADARRGKSSRKGSTSEARRARRPSVRAPKKRASVSTKARKH